MSMRKYYVKIRSGIKENIGLAESIVALNAQDAIQKVADIIDPQSSNSFDWVQTLSDDGAYGAVKASSIKYFEVELL